MHSSQKARCYLVYQIFTIMQITLIATRHESLGKCNSEELIRILTQLNPEVIFEEIPPTLFGEYYVKKERKNLETEAISRFIDGRSIVQVPVDSDNVPSDDFFKEYERLIKRLEGLTDRNGFDFRTMTDRNRSLTSLYGFDYLNSSYADQINEVIARAIENGLVKIDDKELVNTHEMWKEVNMQREHHMLEQIYDYSKENPYENAAFTIGASHRTSIIDKITKDFINKEFEINWTFYNSSK